MQSNVSNVKINSRGFAINKSCVASGNLVAGKLEIALFAIKFNGWTKRHPVWKTWAMSAEWATRTTVLQRWPPVSDGLTGSGSLFTVTRVRHEATASNLQLITDLARLRRVCHPPAPSTDQRRRERAKTNLRVSSFAARLLCFSLAGGPARRARWCLTCHARRSSGTRPSTSNNDADRVTHRPTSPARTVRIIIIRGCQLSSRPTQIRHRCRPPRAAAAADAAVVSCSSSLASSSSSLMSAAFHCAGTFVRRLIRR